MKKKQISVLILAVVLAFGIGVGTSYLFNSNNDDKVVVEENNQTEEDKVTEKEDITDQVPSKEPEQKPSKEPVQKPNKKPEQTQNDDKDKTQVEDKVSTFNANVYYFDINVETGETKLAKENKVSFKSTKKDELLSRVNCIYDALYESDGIYPAASIKEASIKNGILTVKFSPDFLKNFSGGTMAEEYIITTVNYNFMQIDGVNGVMYKFEQAENATGLHFDYSEPFMKNDVICN